MECYPFLRYCPLESDRCNCQDSEFHGRGPLECHCRGEKDYYNCQFDHDIPKFADSTGVGNRYIQSRRSTLRNQLRDYTNDICRGCVSFCNREFFKATRIVFCNFLSELICLPKESVCRTIYEFVGFDISNLYPATFHNMFASSNAYLNVGRKHMFMHDVGCQGYIYPRVLLSYMSMHGNQGVTFLTQNKDSPTHIQCQVCNSTLYIEIISDGTRKLFYNFFMLFMTRHIPKDLSDCVYDYLGFDVHGAYEQRFIDGNKSYFPNDMRV